MLLREIVGDVFLIAIVLVIARFVIDWVMVFAPAYRPTGFVAVIFEILYSITDPPLRAIRSVVPPVRIGPTALDFAPMILLIGIYVLQYIVLGLLAAFVG